jgi:hypothetical protein
MDKKFTVVGTAVNPDGTCKVRYANDFVSRIKTLDKAGCTEIKLYELQAPMTKLQACRWLREQDFGWTEMEREAIDMKLADKTREDNRRLARATLTDNINNAVVTNKETDPRVAAFIEKHLDKMISE